MKKIIDDTGARISLKKTGNVKTREFVIQGTKDEVDRAKLQLTKSLEGGDQS